MLIGNEGETPERWHALIREPLDPASILADHPPADESDRLASRARSDWLRENVLPRIVVIWTSEEDCEAEFDAYVQWDKRASPTCEEWNSFTFPGTLPIEHRMVSRKVGDLVSLDYHHPWWDFIKALDNSELERESDYHRIR